MIAFAPRFPATWLSETYARSDNLSRLTCKLANVGKNKYVVPRSVNNIYIQGLKYDDPPIPEAENSISHPIGKAENIVTHLLCALAHPHLYLLTGP